MRPARVLSVSAVHIDASVCGAGEQTKSRGRDTDKVSPDSLAVFKAAGEQTKSRGRDTDKVSPDSLAVFKAVPGGDRPRLPLP